MARRARANSATGPSTYYRQAWTTTPAAYDILAASPGASTDAGEGLCCRFIIVGTAGTLVLTPPDGQDAETIYFPAGVPIPVQATALGAASTALQVSLYW
jgi:hypothetical protein